MQRGSGFRSYVYLSFLSGSKVGSGESRSFVADGEVLKCEEEKGPFECSNTSQLEEEKIKGSLPRSSPSLAVGSPPLVLILGWCVRGAYLWYWVRCSGPRTHHDLDLSTSGPSLSLSGMLPHTPHSGQAGLLELPCTQCPPCCLVAASNPPHPHTPAAGETPFQEKGLPDGTTSVTSLVSLLKEQLFLATLDLIASCSYNV